MPGNTVVNVPSVEDKTFAAKMDKQNALLEVTDSTTGHILG